MAEYDSPRRKHDKLNSSLKYLHKLTTIYFQCPDGRKKMYNTRTWVDYLFLVTKTMFMYISLAQQMIQQAETHEVHDL
jgi:hypothetical protein